MEATLTIGVIKNGFWSLRNVNSPAAPKLSAIWRLCRMFVRKGCAFPVAAPLITQRGCALTSCEAQPRWVIKVMQAGKPEAFRTARRQSRRKSARRFPMLT